MAEPWQAIPLEIGTTAASRAFLHLAQSGALARWPYGHDRVSLITTSPSYNIKFRFGSRAQTLR